MALDVIDLRSFYGSPLGETTRKLVGAILRERWEGLSGLSIMGLGYATPYLDFFHGQPLRLLAMMPAEQGVVNWPPSGASASALIDGSMLPLPDSCIDRVLLAHALETAEHPHALLEEIWRVLTPGGRLIVVAPNRSGLWARLDTTPFGQGRPYSRGQLRDLMRETSALSARRGAPDATRAARSRARPRSWSGAAADGFRPPGTRRQIPFQARLMLYCPATCVELGALAISPSIRSRSRLKSLSILPSNCRVRASFTRMGSTKWPLTITS